MIPSNTNMTSPCTPVSSNCVIWQGPDISCIDLCKGDTVSDVVAALAVQLCEIIESACTWCEPDLTSLDLKCALPVAPLPAPADLEETLQAIIDYLCEVVAGETTIPLIPLPECFYYKSLAGILVTELPLVDWAVLIGNKICDNLYSIQIINQNIINLENRIVVLENCVLPCDPSGKSPDTSVISSCLFPSTSVASSVLLLTLETAFCNLRDATGTVGQINTAISAQCLNATSPSLAAGGVSSLGNITGWVNTPATLAESNVNQWLAICDIYAAVADIQTNCCDTGCAGVNFGFIYTTIDGTGNGVPDSINLNFQSCNIPAGFSDCGGSTTVTITDSNGASVTQNIVISTLATDPGGANIGITALNTLTSLLIQIDFCVTDNVSQCAESQQVIVPLSIPCPTGVVVAVVTSTAFSVTFPNTLGTSVSYTITATSQTTGVVLGTTSIANPSPSISYTFVGATAGETYNVQITVASGELTVVCPIQSITIPGSVCSDVETNTPSVDPVEVLDYYLGLYDNGVIVTRYWYDAADQIIKAENAGVTVPCDSPILTSPVMDYLAIAGNVAVDVSYGTEPSPTDFEISWSVDGVTYLGLTSYAGAPVNPVVIATGQTSGSVYIKVETTCTGPLQSVPSIIRYDFGTTAWTTIQSPAECADTSITAGCPAGIEVARQYLDCGPATYTIFGGSADSYWFYVGKIVVGLDTRYIYAGWDNATQSVRSVVECCTCPTFILQDIIQVLCGEAGDSVNVTIPYVLGSSGEDGEPSMIIVSNPVLGSVVQGAVANEFVYTSAATTDNDYADTFQVQLSPFVQGTDGCSLAQATVQVTNVNCNVKLEHTNQDIYAFIHTQGYTDVEGAQIKQGMTELTDQWTIDFGFSGNIYFIPTDDDRWLGYHKAIVDDGVSWLQSASAAWQALEVLPTSWSGGVGVYKNAACVIIFSNESSTDYHPTTLGAGWSSQPNPLYKENFDEYVDMTMGTALSTWGLALNITQPQFPDGLSSILYPLTVDGSGSDDAANILQMLAAYTAELIPVEKYGIPTAVDVTSYMLAGAPAMPYDGSVTPAGNTIVNLYKNTAQNCGMLALLDQEKTTANITEINDGTNAQFTETLTRAIRSCSDAYPATTIPTDDRYEVRDCADDEIYFVTITDHGCGTIPNGIVVKLQNNGGAFAPGGGDPRVWDALEYKCLLVIDNCSATVVEVTTDLDSTSINCAGCTP